MKYKMIDLLVKILVWLDASVMINFETKGGSVKSKKAKCSLHKNTFENTNFLSADGEPFPIPEGKFYCEREPVNNCG